MKKNFFKKILALVLSLGMLIQIIPTAFATQNSDFVDFPTGWSAEAVSAAESPVWNSLFWAHRLYGRKCRFYFCCHDRFS